MWRFALLLLPMLLATGCRTPAARVTPLQINAVVVDTKGTRTQVKDLAFRKRVGSFNLINFVDQEREHIFTFDYVPLDTGMYIVDVPLAAISKITVVQEDNPGAKVTQRWGHYDAFYAISVTLADGATHIDGEMGTATSEGGLNQTHWNLLGGLATEEWVVGSTGLDDYKTAVVNVREIDILPHERYKWEVPPKRPSGRSRKSRSFRAQLPKDGILRLADGKTLAIKSLYCLCNPHNANMVPQEAVKSQSFRLSVDGGTARSFGLSGVSMIRFLTHPEAPWLDRYSAPGPVEILTTSGESYRGNAASFEDSPFGIGGTAVFGGIPMQVVVPFATTALEIKFAN